jgi:hypothetical protein
MLAQALKVVALAIVLALPASAQQRDRSEFAFRLGAYVPMRQLSPPTFAVSDICTKHPEEPDCGGPAPSPRLRQASAVAVGGRVTTWIGNRGAIEEWLWYAPSGVSGTFPADGTLVVVGARLLLSLAPRSSATSALVMGGPAMIFRSGAAYAGTRGTTSPAGSLGLGLDFHSTGRFGFRVELEDYLYSVKFGESYAAGGGVGPWKFQQDLVLSLSVNRFHARGESAR